MTALLHSDKLTKGWQYDVSSMALTLKQRISEERIPLRDFGVNTVHIVF